MENDSSTNGQDLCAKQKAWNATYYQFLDVFQRSLIEYADLFPTLFEDIEKNICTGQLPDALKTLYRVKQLLTEHFRQELEMVQTHHGHVNHAMACYQSTVAALHAYGATHDDPEITQVAEMQLAGINDFSLAGIAHLQ